MNLINNEILAIDKLCKTYHRKDGEVHAIKDFSLKINKGDFISIIGTSGCGKSSILNILSGLDKNYKGSFKFKDDTKIGYMLQEDSLFNWLTVYENAIIGLRVQKKLNENTKKHVDKLLAKYGLSEFKNKYPQSLSGGMRQRVALIRTLAIEPDILLLDEPFSALDYQTRLQVSDDVYSIIKEEQVTVLMVTHDIAEAIVRINITKKGCLKPLFFYTTAPCIIFDTAEYICEILCHVAKPTTPSAVRLKAF